MSLVNCNKCQKQVADTAEKCPHCGAKLKDSFLEKLLKIGIKVGIGYFVVVIIIIIIAYNTI